jgi:Mg2+-importing ATPase
MRDTPPAAALAALPQAGFIDALGVSPDGLSRDEAARRLTRYGRNEPVATRSLSVRATLASLFNPLLLILLLSAGVSAMLGDLVGASIIAAMVGLSLALDFVLSHRSQQAAERLRREVAPTATVRRDGAWCERPRAELVPGDLIRLAAGDRIPADARLLDARDLHVQQAALTGESLPAEKEAVDVPSAAPDGTARHIVYMGTSVIAGTATAMVFATGATAMFGDVAGRLAERPPQTDFERGMAAFSAFIARTVLLLVLFVMLAGVAMGRPGFESLLFAVALAVGLTPEFMPMIMTVTLARGALRMARRNVIVKHLAAIDGFGSMDILLSDKTGTLTSGEMTLDHATDAFGAPCERAFELARVNSFFQTGVRSPLDTAILGVRPFAAEGWRKLDEIPFDFERRRLSVVAEREGRILLVSKGAPESLLGCCSRCEAGGRIAALDDGLRARCAEAGRALGEQGLRVIAVAYADAAAAERYGVGDERDLVLAGFLCFADPPVPGIAETLRALRRDGIEVKILTGDDERVARRVCETIGLDPGVIVLGSETDGLGDAALAALAERHTIFARMLPAQKHRVVVALKLRGHVVGFLGDGVNDAPSLHAADVGISVVNAADIAKDAADIILRERRLDVLHEGVIEGRRAFANVMKYLLMGTSSNFGNMFSMAAGVLFLPFLPMLPTQILLNNFLYDLAQVTIPTDRVDPASLRAPQRWDIRLIRRFMWVAGPISSLYDFLTFFILLKVFHADERLFHTGWFVESLTTQTLVLFVIRTAGSCLRSRPSTALVASTSAVIAFALLLPFLPWAEVLGFTPLQPAFFAFLGVAAITYLAIVEGVKRRLFAPAPLNGATTAAAQTERS